MGGDGDGRDAARLGAYDDAGGGPGGGVEDAGDGGGFARARFGDYDEDLVGFECVQDLESLRVDGEC